MNYTPGPWIVQKTKIGNLNIIKERGERSLTMYIAEIIQGGIPNAKLIAAAPELLENCIATLEDLESGSLKKM